MTYSNNILAAGKQTAERPRKRNGKITTRNDLGISRAVTVCEPLKPDESHFTVESSRGEGGRESSKIIEVFSLTGREFHRIGCHDNGFVSRSGFLGRHEESITGLVISAPVGSGVLDASSDGEMTRNFSY